jgi:ABC-2 type transport system permease protein
MAKRGLIKIRRNPEQLADVLIQPIIFTLLFTFLFGGAIAGDIASYLPIIIPGILVQSVITGSIATGVQLRDDMDKGVFNRFRSLPIARIAPLAGALLADVLRYAIIVTLTMLMGFILGMNPTGGLFGVLAASLLVIVVGWCISWIFAFMGTIMRTSSSVTGVSMIVLMPLTFLSNAFVPVDTLPSILKAFAEINPVSHIISAVRELLAAGTIGTDFWWAIVGSLTIVAIFAPLALHAYKKKA